MTPKRSGEDIVRALPLSSVPASVGQVGEARNKTVEECAVNLARWYPDNANTNAFCAALRSMKTNSQLGETATEAKAARTPSASEKKRGVTDSHVHGEANPVSDDNSHPCIAAEREQLPAYSASIPAPVVDREAALACARSVKDADGRNALLPSQVEQMADAILALLHAPVGEKNEP